MEHENLITEYLEESLVSIKGCSKSINELCSAANILVKALYSGNKILFCGNGGSAAQSQHLAAEFSGKFLMDRPALSSISLTTDTSAITAIANDYGYDMVFKRQLEAIGKSGDVLVGISTSGASKSVIEAFKAAKELGILTIALTGSNVTPMSVIADQTIRCSAKGTNFIQEQQFVVGHILCYLVEKTVNAGQKS